MEVPGIDVDAEANDPPMERDKGGGGRSLKRPGEESEGPLRRGCEREGGRDKKRPRDESERLPMVSTKELPDDPGNDWEKRAMCANKRWTASYTHLFFTFGII